MTSNGILSGPTHVLVVRGLDENADEDMIRYEFSKHAPIKVNFICPFNLRCRIRVLIL